MEKSSVAEREVVITRVFDAPRELVWKMWTDPAHFMRWFSPKGFTTPAAQLDVRVGGKYLACMRSPEGQEVWITGIYREVVPPERLAYTDNFADKDGNLVPASHYGMSGEWPAESTVSLLLEEVEGSKTRLTMRHTGLPDDEENAGGALDGWSEMLDKLAEQLAQG